MLALLGIFIIAGLGVIWVSYNDTPSSVSTDEAMPSADISNEICVAKVTNSTPDNQSPPFAYNIEIDYRGQPLENVRFDIESPYTEMRLTINGTRYEIVGTSAMMSQPINFTNSATLVLYYDGMTAHATQTLALITDDITVNCYIPA